jgi:predicted PhzF superfamily epimerase YddE/YHI9
MAHSFAIIDAFATGPFSGNPAAVVRVNGGVPDAWCQAIAREFNLSETAFLFPGEVAGEIALRWFTPTVEVELCGHATLAAASFLFHDGMASPIRFATLSGCLTAVQTADGIALDFPATEILPHGEPIEWEVGLGVEPEAIYRAGADHLVVLKSAQAVIGLSPDFDFLKTLSGRGVIVTAEGAAPYHCVSRFFAPNYGINEDPVTGSAHCALAVYWQRRLGRSEIHGYQASQRGGAVMASATGDRVCLSGKAIRVAEGVILV